MTPEEMKQIADVAAKAAQEATQKAIDSNSAEMTVLKEQAVAHAKEMKDLALQVKSGEAEVTRVGDTLHKVAKAAGHVSLVRDLGAGKSELQHDKAKMYRGMLTGNWHGADKEKEIAFAVREKALQTGEGTAGGYVLATEMSTDIFEAVRDRNVLAELGCMNISPNRSRFELPGVDTGATGYFTGEGNSISISDMKFKLIAMEAKKAAAIVAVSKEMIASADPAVVAILERDMAASLAYTIMYNALYGNGANSTPIGLANIPGVTKYTVAVDTNGSAPTKAFMRAMKASVPQKYVSNSFRFLANNNTNLQIATLVEAATPTATALVSDDVIIRNAYGLPYSTSGHVAANKTLGSGVNLSDLFYGSWEEFVYATWYGGMRIESTVEGGNAFVNDLMLFKAVMPVNFACRRPDTFVQAPFVKTILS
jgi:HK97 family phage major capsid protein